MTKKVNVTHGRNSLPPQRLVLRMINVSVCSGKLFFFKKKNIQLQPSFLGVKGIQLQPLAPLSRDPLVDVQRLIKINCK